MDATPIERVASPAEFAQLLAALDPRTPCHTRSPATAWVAERRSSASAGQGSPQSRRSRMGRRVGSAQVRGIPSAGADRPAVARAAQARVPGAGAPEGGPRLPAPRRLGNNGPAEHGLARQARCEDLERSRAPADHPAGGAPQCGNMARCRRIPSKIASVLMGHATPERQPGAAQITLARYTHALPEDIERARAKLAAYLAEAQKAEAAGQ